MILQDGIASLAVGSLVTGLLLTSYAATNYIIPAAGEPIGNGAGWEFNVSLFIRALPYLLSLSFLLFITVGSTVYWFLKKQCYLNYSSVAFVATIVGLLNPLVHESDTDVPYGLFVYVLGAVSIPIGAMISLLIIKRRHGQ